MSLLLTIVITFAAVCASSARNAAQYGKLPRIYEYDDFGTCRRTYRAKFVYCVATTELLPDPTSELWMNISLLTSNRKNFPHDQLERGLCMNGNYRPVGDADIRQHVESIARTHLTAKIYNHYGLHSRTKINSCWTAESFGQKRTIGEWVFLCTSLCLFVITVYATWKVHERDPSGAPLLETFAIQQNIRRLTKAPGASCLPFLEGLRAIGMLTILVVHAQLPMIRMPVKNTDDLEAQANHVAFPVVNSANTHMIQFFFALGGMVFALSCLNHFESSRSFRALYFLEKLLRRLIRIVPAYGFIILYQATWYRRLKRGPLEYKFYDYCSDHWWTNLLFVNNYVLPTEPCLQYGWYLGADFHLFLAGSLLLALVWRFPGTGRPIAALMAICALLIPACVIYTGSTAATMTFDMRHALAELRTYDHFLKYYLPSHTNLGGYFFGMIAAMLYKGVVEARLQDRVRPTLRRAFGVSFVALVGLNAFTMVLPSLDIEPRRSLFHAVYGSLLKASWGCTYGVVFLLLALKAKSPFIRFLSHPLMHCLAKLSYCVYIVQYSVIYGIYTNFPVPLTYGAFNLTILTASSVLLSLIGAFLLHMAVEAPIGHLGNKWLTLLLRKNVIPSESSAEHLKKL